MSEHQNVIDNIEYVLSDLTKLRSFVEGVQSTLSCPQSKKALREFSEAYLLDKVLSASELNPIYARLTLGATDINIDLFHQALGRDTPLITALKKALQKKISITYESALCAVNNTYLITDKHDEAGKTKAQSLQYALGKINAIFATARQLPISPDQFAELPVSSSKESDISRSIEENIKQMQCCTDEKLDALFCQPLLTLLSADVENLHPFLCKNNYLSLRHFILYLNTL